MSVKFLLRLFVALQIGTILVIAVTLLIKFPVWSPIDEGAHFTYIQYVAEEHRLPVLGRDPVTTEVLSISEKIYPEKSSSDPAKLGIGGQAYEAFQPPLYYILAVPFFFFSDDYMNKVYLLRGFDFLLLLGSIFLLWGVAKAHYRQPLFPFSMGLNFFLLPGVLLRSITISNAALTIPIALLFIWLLVKFDRSEDNLLLLAAGLTFAAASLTHLTLLYLLPVLVIVIVRHYLKRRDLRKLLPTAVGSLSLAVIPIVPWLIFNYRHYGAWSANNLAKTIQSPIINPQGLNYSFIDAFHMVLGNRPGLSIPEEWLTVAYKHSSAIDSQYFIYYVLLVIPVFLTLLNFRVKSKFFCKFLVSPRSSV
ncbi:MAG: hypothetical protein IBX61_09950, partial [Thermoleophilia bacterium]|nr:hypothetical protein [Thermoleophilia bacterium]